MSYDPMEGVAGSQAWIRATFTLEVQLQMRDELRTLVHVTGALAAVVWMGHDRSTERIAFVGSFRALPDRYPFVDDTVATVHRDNINGQRCELVAQIVQLGLGLPSLRVAAVGPETIGNPVMHAVEDCAARLEHIAVAALSAKAAA